MVWSLLQFHGTIALEVDGRVRILEDGLRPDDLVCCALGMLGSQRNDMNHAILHVSAAVKTNEATRLLHFKRISAARRRLQETGLGLLFA